MAGKSTAGYTQIFPSWEIVVLRLMLLGFCESCTWAISSYCLSYQLGGAGGLLIVLLLWMWTTVTLARGATKKEGGYGYENYSISCCSAFGTCCVVGGPPGEASLSLD